MPPVTKQAAEWRKTGRMVVRRPIAAPVADHGSAPDHGLFAQAEAAAANAYAPYSHFHVGAAIRSAMGETYTGVNVENVSYPVGTCAEAGAIAAARSAEGAKFAIAAIAIAASDDDGVARPCSPCGACRQRIAEFSTAAPVTFRGASGALVCETIDTLLPYQFSFEPDQGAE